MSHAATNQYGAMTPMIDDRKVRGEKLCMYTAMTIHNAGRKRSICGNTMLAMPRAQKA